jgi:hypothetical protein
MKGKAQISEISGGVFLGRNDSVHISDAGTKIDLISGGSFYQTDPDTTLHGHAVFVQNEAQIGEISGGYFEAARSSALYIIRSGWVDEISGGEFVAKRSGTISNNDRNAAIGVVSENKKTGIGTISGGHIKGTNFGLLVYSYYQGARVNEITGGLFEGVVALQNDVNCEIGEISGGPFIGNQGMLNDGKIGKISGQADILGKTSYGIFNYQYGHIDEISGGLIASDSDYGILNGGTIRLISGGTMIGRYSAIRCSPSTNGKIDTISGGVFWGQMDVAISLDSAVKLEPGLNTPIGSGRYWGKDGVIFSDENLVKYPGTAPNVYFMSTKTTPVAGLQNVQFKFLTLSDSLVEVTFDCNGGSFNDKTTTVTRLLDAGDTLDADMPDAPMREGYTFLGWNTNKGGVLVFEVS